MRYHGVPYDLNVMQPMVLSSRRDGYYTLRSAFGWLGSEFFISAPNVEETSAFEVQCNAIMCSLIRHHGVPIDLNAMQPMILGSTMQLYVKFDQLSRSP